METQTLEKVENKRCPEAYYSIVHERLNCKLTGGDYACPNQNGLNYLDCPDYNNNMIQMINANID